MLSGGLREGVFKEVLINGRSFKLELRQFVVLLILACRALTMAALPSPLRIEGELFLPAKAIVAEVEALATRLKARGLGTWESKHVWNAVWEMREMFQAAGANPNLIQVERGYGYRLSVPPANIIALFDSSV